jgi:hypothetical protein
MEHVRAHVGHAWNEKADRLANEGHTCSTSGVFYDVDPKAWYAYQMDKEVKTLADSAEKAGVLIPGDVVKQITTTARNAALNRLAEKHDLSYGMLGRLLRVELSRMSRLAQAFVAALLTGILQVSDTAELTNNEDRTMAIFQRIGDENCKDYSQLLFGVNKNFTTQRTRKLDWMKIKSSIEETAKKFSVHSTANKT